MEWKPIDTAPFDRDFELAVIDGVGVHALSFSCRRVFTGWVSAETEKRLYYILPTHWRDRSSSSAHSVASAHGESVRTSAEVLTERLAAIHRASSRVNNL